MSGIFVIGNLIYYVYNGHLIGTTTLSDIRGTTQTAVTVENIDIKEYLKEMYKR